jgi:hypothetical protein
MNIELIDYNPLSSRSDGIEDVLARVESQLARIEALCESHRSESISTASLSGLAVPQRSPFTDEFLQSYTIVPDGRPGASSSRSFWAQWPDLESFHSLPPLNPIQYDDREEYYAREMRRCEGFASPAATSIADLDLSPQTCWRLQQYFVRNVLSWVPLFDQTFLVTVVEYAATFRFANTDLSTALALLVLSLGAISNDDENTGDEPAEFAGIQYFIHGFRLASLTTAQTTDILAVQCNILSS